MRESSWPQLQSSTSKGRGGLPEHFRMEYTIVLPTSSFITIFSVSPFGRGFCFNFLDPGIQPRSRKKIISWYLPHHSHLQLYSVDVTVSSTPQKSPFLRLVSFNMCHWEPLSWKDLSYVSSGSKDKLFPRSVITMQAWGRQENRIQFCAPFQRKGQW